MALAAVMPVTLRRTAAATLLRCQRVLQKVGSGTFRGCRSSSRIYHLSRTPPGGRCGTELLLERTGKRRFRFVSDLLGDPSQRIAGVPQLLPGDLQVPVGEVVHRRHADHPGEPFAEARAR